MKKILNTIINIVMFTFIFLSTVTHLGAKEKLFITKDNIKILDQFITVCNNQFVFDIPDYVVIDEQLKMKLTQMTDQINYLIKENNYYIDTVTKIAQPRIQPRAYGVNRITLSWNSIIIKMDAGMVKLVTKAVAAGGVAVATAIPGLVSFIAANPIIGASGLAVGTSVIDSLLDSNIKDGVEIHYNFFFGHVTLVRRQ